MAQAEEIIEDENEHEEAEELEQLLANTDNDGTDEVAGDEESPKKGGRFSFGGARLFLPQGERWTAGAGAVHQDHAVEPRLSVRRGLLRNPGLRALRPGRREPAH